MKKSFTLQNIVLHSPDFSYNLSGEYLDWKLYLLITDRLFFLHTNSQHTEKHTVSPVILDRRGHITIFQNCVTQMGKWEASEVESLKNTANILF